MAILTIVSLFLAILFGVSAAPEGTSIEERDDYHCEHSDPIPVPVPIQLYPGQIYLPTLPKELSYEAPSYGSPSYEPEYESEAYPLAGKAIRLVQKTRNAFRNKGYKLPKSPKSSYKAAKSQKSSYKLPKAPKSTYKLPKAPKSSYGPPQGAYGNPIYEPQTPSYSPAPIQSYNPAPAPSYDPAPAPAYDPVPTPAYDPLPIDSYLPIPYKEQQPEYRYRLGKSYEFDSTQDSYDVFQESDDPYVF